MDVKYPDVVRLVLDTNVIVAAFRSRLGASNALLRLADKGSVVPLCSTALFLEYEAVLSRSETREVTGQTLADVEAVMRSFATIAEAVDVSFRVRPILRDADDEMVLEAAVNGNAKAIVTHNRRNFEPAREFGVEIASPGDIVVRLRK